MGVYVIAEIGQNHNGDVELAKTLVRVAHWAGCDAVKFTKRDLRHEMTVDAWDAPYDSWHSYGRTYGEHRAWLELSAEEIAACRQLAEELGMQTVVTACNPGAADDILTWFQPDRWKVASRDLGNVPLLRRMGETGIPVILSTGMDWGSVAIRKALDAVGRPATILHCLSEYPAPYERLNLGRIAELRDDYPDCEIGWSDHTNGSMVAAWAVVLGAEVVEKHVTLNRAGKGSDHACSAESHELWRMVRSVRNAELAMADWADVPANEKHQKLARSACWARDLAVGQVVCEGDVIMLSPGNGLSWGEASGCVGRKLRVAVSENTPVALDDLLDSETQ